MDFKKYMVAILILTFSANILSIEKECKAKKIQLMKPLFPSVNVSGYTIIEFDVDQNGKIQKPRSIESKCLLQKRGSDDKEFKNCGVFIYESMKSIRLDVRNLSRVKSLHDSEKRLELNSVRVWMVPDDPLV